ncbi:MAG: ammonium transporter, partial [Nitriliruptorales bacterium]
MEELAYAIDTVWVAACAALVLLMHLGFALVETGLTRAKNAANIVGKNMATVAIGALAYWAIGAALAYGADVAGFIGLSGFFAPADILGDGTQSLFQLVFAATAATIVSGAVAERIKFATYLVVATVLTGVIYPIITHWQWFGEGGWLFDLGFHDFAGSTMVHLTGGMAALAGVLVLGPRIGKYGKDGRPRAIPGHNIPFAIAGVLVLFFGWFGFNGGSTLGAVGQAELIGTILLNTTLAGGAGAIAAGAVNWLQAGKPDPAMIGNGALAGLVGITAGPDLATNGWAVLVGLVAGAVVVGSVLVLDRLRVDDPVGAISVHGTCGALGTLFVGVYSAEHTVGVQAIGVLAAGSFAFLAVGGVFLALKATVGVRVSERAEVEGLDGHEHGVYGYPGLVLGPSADPAGPGRPAGAPVASPLNPATG